MREKARREENSILSVYDWRKWIFHLETNGKCADFMSIIYRWIKFKSFVLQICKDNLSKTELLEMLSHIKCYPNVIDYYSILL